MLLLSGVSTPRPTAELSGGAGKHPPELRPAPPQGRWVGAAAERRAERHLWLRGWRICARNWIGGGGELDLVVSRWRTVLIVEVRRRPSLAEAFASVDRDKLDRTIAAAHALVRTYGLERYRLCFDVIAIADHGELEWRRDLLRVGTPGY